MRLNTEHDVNEKVWVVYNNKVERGIITKIGVFGEFTNQDNIHFIYYIIPLEIVDTFKNKRPESFFPNRVFKSKEDAEATLVG